MKSKFGKSYIQPLFYNCAKAYTVKQYEYWRGLLVAGNTRIEKYIDDANPQLWARCMFPGRRFNLMTTNISECLNSVLKEARGWPVACLVLSFRSLLQRWFNEKRNLIPLMVSGLTGKALNLFTKAESDARTMNVSVTVLIFVYFGLFQYRNMLCVAEICCGLGASDLFWFIPVYFFFVACFLGFSLGASQSSHKTEEAGVHRCVMCGEDSSWVGCFRFILAYFRVFVVHP